MTPGPPDIAWPAIAAVALLTVMALVAHWWLRGRGLIPSSQNPIRLVATRSLGAKRAVAIVEIESERFLLGLTDEAVSCLSRLQPPHAAAADNEAVVAFAAGRGR